MDIIEVSSKTYDDAVTDALVQLGATSDQVEIEVLDKGSSGFLGIGARPVKIRVSKKFTAETYLRKFLSDIFMENYRVRRRETLENLARNIAYKVKRTRHSVALEPMNPFERRVIHSALQNDRYVITHSEGDEPFRHVVVALRR